MYIHIYRGFVLGSLVLAAMDGANEVGPSILVATDYGRRHGSTNIMSKHQMCTLIQTLHTRQLYMFGFSSLISCTRAFRFTLIASAQLLLSIRTSMQLM